MTPTNTDAAREAAKVDAINSMIVDTFIKAVRDYGDNKSSYREDTRYGLKQVAPLIIKRFLSKTLEGADEKLAEIRDWYVVLAALPPEGPGISMAEYKSAFNSLGTLLTLVTALSAKLKEVEADNDRLHEGWKQAFSIGIAKQEEIEKLESELTATRNALEEERERSDSLANQLQDYREGKLP